jgi:DNA-binding CsgD family transcriptional regulator
MKLEEAILDRVNLTLEDLTANLRGELSSQQQRFLKNKQFSEILGALAFLIMLFILITALTLKIIFPTFADRGVFFIVFPVGLFWLWLLRSSPRSWLQTNREIQERQVATVVGQVQCRISGNIGLIQLPHYTIRIAAKNFKVSEDIYFQFKNRENYKVFYTPLTKTLLGSIQITETAPILEEASLGDSENLNQIEVLTPRDKELLGCIAAGLSNKEIAAQLSLSPNTVKMYTSKLYRKLGARRRTDAVKRARQLNLL